MTNDDMLIIERQHYLADEDKFKRLADIAIKLGKSIVCPVWDMKIQRRDGSIRVHRQSFNDSWTRNALNIHTQFCFFGIDAATMTYVDGGLGVKRTNGGVIATVYNNALALETSGYNGSENDDIHGIVIGTGSTAETLNDFALETPIVDGSSGGEMEYGITSKELDQWDAGNSWWESQWERWFDNLSGGTITVNEFCLYHETASSRMYCMIRDIISGGQAVLDTERLIINQEFRAVRP